MPALYPYSTLRYSICVPLSSASGTPKGIKTMWRWRVATHNLGLYFRD